MNTRNRFLIVFAAIMILISSSAFAISNWDRYENDPAVASYDVMSRAYRLPGEPTYYDPLTGVEFIPDSGVITNLSSFSRWPGEPIYSKSGYKAFYAPMYSQYIPKDLSIDITTDKTGDGFTLYLGFSVSGGFLGGGSLGGNIAISYAKDTKTWHLGTLGSGTGSAIIGSEFDAQFNIGLSDGDHTTLSGWSMGASGEVPIAEVSVSQSLDTMHTTVQISPQIGASANYSENISYSFYKEIDIWGFFK